MGVVVLRVSEPVNRLDRLIADRCPGLSRSAAQRLIKSGQVLVNGLPSKASHYPLEGDLIRVQLPSRAPLVPMAERIPLRILFEDEYLLVVDKPAGLVVHPGPGHASGTLVNALLAYRSAVADADLDPQRPGIVHRLDRDTSGVLVVATTREAQSALQEQFRSRRVEKTYLVLVHGRLAPEEAAIDAPIGRDPRDRKRMKVVAEGGRYARTEYRVREYLPGCTLAKAKPLTGRTHQLRVHFASVGHPVVGDRVYGRRCRQIKAPRQLLHAWRLAFAHPVTGEELRFATDAPADFCEVLEGLRKAP